jgi:hypothetical protein
VVNLAESSKKSYECLKKGLFANDDDDENDDDGDDDDDNDYDVELSFNKRINFRNWIL